MPRTVEGIVEAHRAAAARRARGLPNWDRQVDLKDVWGNEDLTFEQRRDAIVARLRASTWLRGYGEDDVLVQLVEELSEAEDGNEFDSPWDLIYDYADADRVWIGTF